MYCDGSDFMKKILVSKEKKSRESMINPYSDKSMKERLCQAKVVNMENNFVLQDCGNGYFSIRPIDRTKVFE